MLKPWLLMAPMLLIPLHAATAHHVLGRPAYSLNEDSNTPPSMQGEASIGDYRLTYMIFPAFPRPGEPGRIHLYIAAAEGARPFTGNVSFFMGGDRWWRTGDGVALGVQPPNGHVYRQGFRVEQAGDYRVTVRFAVDGEPYSLDFPMRVGAPPLLGPLEITVGLVIALLIAVSLIFRRRAMTGKIRAARR